MAYLIRIGALEGFVELMDELNADLEFLLRQVGLKKSVFEKPDNLVSYQSAYQLLELASAQTQNQNIGVLLAFRRSGLVLGLFGILCRQSPDVMSAVDQAIRNIQLHNQIEDWELKNLGEESRFVRYLRDKRMPASTQMHEMAMGDVTRFMMFLGDGKFRLRCVHFSHSAPADIDIYQRLFNTEVRFDQGFNGISFDSSFLKRKIQSQDQDIQKHVDHYIDSMQKGFRSDIVTQTTHLIEQTITSADCNINTISQLLSMHKRTLQKKLDQHNTNFSELLERTRWGKAQQILQNSSMPLSKLASLLGYSESSAFSRAFKKDFGVSPKDWRKLNQ